MQTSTCPLSKIRKIEENFDRWMTILSCICTQIVLKLASLELERVYSCCGMLFLLLLKHMFLRLLWLVKLLLILGMIIILLQWQNMLLALVVACSSCRLIKIGQKWTTYLSVNHFLNEFAVAAGI